MLAFLEWEGQTFPQAALRYCLERPGVSTIIAGTQRVEHLEENVAALNGKLTNEEVGRVEELQKAGAFEGVQIP
jgi:aryl-alcohol dehydrogenase-like predicted oxidoreductase